MSINHDNTTDYIPNFNSNLNINVIKKLYTSNNSTVWVIESNNEFSIIKGYLLEKNSDDLSASHIKSERQILTVFKEKSLHPYWIKALKDEKYIYLNYSLTEGIELNKLVDILNFDISNNTDDFISNSNITDLNSIHNYVEFIEFKYLILSNIVFLINKQLKNINKCNYIYRDLKMSNIIIDDDIYPNIIDYGFSKELVNNEYTNTVCGTYHSMAPEMFINKIVSIFKNIKIDNNTCSNEYNLYTYLEKLIKNYYINCKNEDNINLEKNCYNYKVDCYSLGVLLLELFTQKNVFQYVYEFAIENIINSFEKNFEILLNKSYLNYVQDNLVHQKLNIFIDKLNNSHKNNEIYIKIKDKINNLLLIEQNITELIDGLLHIDYDKRLSIEDVENHTLFKILHINDKSRTNIVKHSINNFRYNSYIKNYIDNLVNYVLDNGIFIDNLEEEYLNDKNNIDVFNNF